MTTMLILPEILVPRPFGVFHSLLFPLDVGTRTQVMVMFLSNSSKALNQHIVLETTRRFSSATTERADTRGVWSGVERGV
jgi:hypothetical protein